ncbi:MAG: GNAT family N-acetyltransferase [Candidatus Acidiferrales bacterium]
MRIETKRLFLREWRETDVNSYIEMSRDIGYNCFSPPGAYSVRDEAEAKGEIRKRMELFAARGFAKFPVFLKQDEDFIGTCGLQPVQIEEKEEIELGYRLCLKHWGRGYALEAATAVLRYGFEDLKLEKLKAFVLPQNRASVRILEKLGCQYQREFLYAGIPHRLYKIDRKNFTRTVEDV